MTKSKKAASSKPKLIFFGNERLATGLPPIKPLVLPALIEAGYEVAAAVVNHSEAQSRSKRPLEIAEVAKKNSIPLLLPKQLSQITDQLASYGAEAAVLVAYGRLIPRSVIDLFPKGIINIHPSLLPLYRGPTPLEQVILDGCSETGVSLMRLAVEMDAGPVLDQKAIRLRGDESKAELAELSLRTGAELLIKNLPKILDGSLSGQLQNDQFTTYTKLLDKADGELNFDEAAPVIERQIRAFSGFPKARAEIRGHDIIITKARVARDADDGELVIKCRPGWLEIQELIAPSGRTMSGKDFLLGHKK